MKQFGVAKLTIFGSTVRSEATENSDVDILVSFEKTPIIALHNRLIHAYLGLDNDILWSVIQFV